MQQPSDPPEAESLRVLTGLARGRFGAIAPERIARHVIAITPDDDWAVRKAAFEALTRRYRFAARDDLGLAERPKAGIFGNYRTKSALKGKRGETRPYVTALSSVEPLATSCSCADFVRSSLGLCKHGLAMLDVLEDGGALARAPEPARPQRSLLRWEFQHPLRGGADRLARLRYEQRGRAASPSGFRDGRALPRMLRDPGQRLSLIAELERGIRRGSLEIEPSIATLLGEERARAERLVSTQPAIGPAMKSLSSLSRKLYPYQREGVKRFFEVGRLLLADDMGLGKTTQAIASCHGLFETKRIRRGLLIVPAALKPQWKREWDSTTRVPLSLVEGSPSERARMYASTKQGFLIIGYEQLLRDLAQVQRFAPEMVVLDEAQRIKNWATKSAGYVKSLSPAYRLVLTGTPMENRFDELASIMDFVDDLSLEPKWRLVPFHALQTGDGGKGVGGARNLDVLRSRLSDSMLRRVRRDVLTQLPARTDTRVPVEMTAAQRDRHDELRQPIAELAYKSARRPLTQAEFLQLMQLLTQQRMICNGLAQVYFKAEWPRYRASEPTPENLEGMFAPKLAALRGLIEQVVIGQQRKAVIFSQWRSMLRLSEWAVRDLLAAAGMRAVFFTGAESPKLREQAVVELHDDPKVTVMFLSDAGGVGLNLQRAASCCINLELPWNPAVLEQRIGRIYRLGQTLPIDVYNLVTEEGIEARIASLLDQKKAVFSTLFDGTTDQVVFDGQSSFLEGVKKLVEPVPLPVNATVEDANEEPLPSLARSDDMLPALAGEENDARDQDASTAQRVAPPSPRQQRPRSEVVDAPAQGEISGSSGASQLSVTRLADGGLRIEAPEALAEPLAALLESLARSLRQAVPPPAYNAATNGGADAASEHAEHADLS
jgi:hypothetical protein